MSTSRARATAAPGLVMLELSHRTTPLSLLERVTVCPERRGELLSTLLQTGCSEAVAVMTCSRVEVYAIGPQGPATLLRALALESGAAPWDLRAAATTRSGLDAAEHLFRVTAGLESRVMGEVDIQTQVRAAFTDARDAGAAGPLLTRLFGAALEAGRRVRTSTGLVEQGRSLAVRAVEIGLSATVSEESVVVVVGSGRMAAAAVEQLVRLGRAPFVVARDPVPAARIAAAERVRAMPALAEGVAQADLLICATSAPHHVVTSEHVSQAMARRPHRPLTVVDLSVPRNVDDTIACLRGVRLVDLEQMDDDLAADEALSATLEQGRALVTTLVDTYAERSAAAAAGPVIAALRRSIEITCRLELLASPDAGSLTAEEAGRRVHLAVGRALHAPAMSARAAAAAGDVDALAALCDRFGVAVPQQPSSADPLCQQTARSQSVPRPRRSSESSWCA